MHLIVYYICLFSVHYMPKVCIIRQKMRQISLGNWALREKKKQIAITTHCWFTVLLHISIVQLFQFLWSIVRKSLVYLEGTLSSGNAPWQRVRVFWIVKCLLHHVSLTWAFVSSFFHDTLCVLEKFFN